MTRSDLCIDQLFRDARTHNGWLDKPVSDKTLREVYDALKWGPTSANASPGRFVFVRTAKGRERLRPSLAPGNLEKTMAAPVTVIVAYDLQFYEKLPKLFPHNPGMRDLFTANPALVEVTARRNSSLQGAYLILAARALGLDCGPMSGFDKHFTPTRGNAAQTSNVVGLSRADAVPNGKRRSTAAQFRSVRSHRQVRRCDFRG